MEVDLFGLERRPTVHCGFLSGIQPRWVGRHGTDVAEATPVRFSPDRSAPGSSGEGPERRGQSIAGSPILAGTGYGSQTSCHSWQASRGRSL